MKGKSLLLAVGLAVLVGYPVRVFAAEEISGVDIDGVLSYTINPGKSQATVTGLAADLPGADTIRIPAQFILGGKIYSVTSIGDSAFAGRSIKYISTEGQLTNIGRDAFRGAELGTFYTADGNGPIAVEAGAFADLQKKSVIVFGKGTNRIAKGVWAGSSFTTLTLSAGLEYLHVEAVDKETHVDDLYIGWLSPSDIPAGLIYGEGGKTYPPYEFFPAFVDNIHTPKTSAADAAYWGNPHWANDSFLFRNSYNITAESFPEAERSWIVPSGGSFPYGKYLTFTALDRPGYHPVRWTVGGKTVAADVSVYSLRVTDDAVVAVYFASDTIVQDGVEYVVRSKDLEATVLQNAEYNGGTTPKIASIVTDVYAGKDYAVRHIGDMAFLGNKNIDSLYIPLGIETIGAGAFAGCDNLQTVVFPASLTSIAPTAFEGAFLGPIRDIYIPWDTAAARKMIGTLLEKLQSVWLHVPIAYRSNYGVQFMGAYVVSPISVWVSPNVAAYGTVEGSGVFSYGDTVVIKAFPAQGYEFRNWTTRKGDILSSKQVDSIRVIADEDIVAVFSPKICVVTVSSAGNGEGGHISLGQGGSYNYGDSLFLEATPDRGNLFGYWLISTSVVGVDGALVEKKWEVTNKLLKERIIGDMDIVAVFNLVSDACRLRVSSSLSGKGTLSIFSPQIGEVLGVIDTALAYGASVTLDVKNLAEGYYVTWVSSAGAILSTVSPYTFKLNSSRDIIARFANQYSVSLEVEKGGSVLGLSGQSYPYGAPVKLTAIPDPGYVFKGWTITGGKDPGVFTSERYDLVVTGNTAITAAFSPRKYRVSALSTTGGYVSGVNVEYSEYENNTVLHLDAIPYEDYRFVGWIGNNNTIVSSLRSYDLVVNGDIFLTAVFVFIEDQYIVACNENYGSVSEPQRSSVFGSVTATAIANPGYSFVGWYDANGLSVSTSSELSFSGPSSRIYIARFAPRTATGNTPLPSSAAASAQAWYASGALHLVNLEGAVAAIVSVGGKSVTATFRIGSDSESKPLSLPTGIYILKATNGKENLVTKFVVRNE
ncbi:MAG: leucine-rich repeat protein [Tannerellaceae bacterium]|nr:leucine-rich repeat protein [Tannerellaceae bacterium]